MLEERCVAFWHLESWNVRTIDIPGKLELFLDELDRLNLEIVGLSETKWI